MDPKNAGKHPKGHKAPEVTNAATDGKGTKSEELQLANLCWGECEEAFAEEEDVDCEAASAEVKSHADAVKTAAERRRPTLLRC